MNKKVTPDDIARKIDSLNTAILNFRVDQEEYQNILEDKIDSIINKIFEDFRELKRSILATKSGCGEF